MRLKLTLIKKHSSQILVFMLFWSCSPDQKEISAINEVNRPTDSSVTANGTKIDLKDSSMLHDDLEMEGDLNCEQHFLARFIKPSRLTSILFIVTIGMQNIQIG